MDHAAVPFDRVLVVHGFRATPQKHWFPWLAQQVPGARVLALPDSAAPDAEAWTTAVAQAIGELDQHTAVIAHSLGCVTTVRAIQRLAARSDAQGPRSAGSATLGAFIAVSPFAEPLTPSGDQGLDAFAATGLAPFLDGVDLTAARPHLGAITVIRSDDDPLVAPQLSDAFAAGLQGRTRIIPGARHFLESHGVTELPEVVEALEASAPPRV